MQAAISTSLAADSYLRRCYAALLQLEREFHAAMADPDFKAELGELLADYTGRPSPITEAKRFSEHAAANPELDRRRSSC